MTIDQEITAASSVLGLLLVFLLGYFAALLPIVLSLLDVPRPDIADDRSALASRLASYRLIIAGLFLLASLVVLILLPLSRRVVMSLRSEGPFATIRVGLLAMGAMLLTLLAATGWLWFRTTDRLRKVRG